ncbi:MAG: OprD family outer membrane porin [Myxococcota bacterium]
MSRGLRRFRCAVVVAALGLGALPSFAAERELDEDPPPSEASDIRTAIQRIFPEPEPGRALFPWLGQALQDLPPFFADSRIDAHFRTAYIRQDRTIDIKSEAWAAGGSLSYRSGWLADTFAVEAEGFTSQPVYKPSGRGGTGLLQLGQDGYSVLGIANAKLRYRGVVLTGYRQYLDLPYLNRSDSRMTPNTFESVTIEKPDGKFRFSTGYTWKIKRRTSDEFVSMTEALGLDVDRGLLHAGAAWRPNEDLYVGAIAGQLHDVYGGVYSEFAFGRPLTPDIDLRLDGQLTYQWDTGADLLGPLVDDTWNIGLRTSASWQGFVLRLGLTYTGSNGGIFSPFGSSPTYVDMMQRTFTRANEKALLLSLSYDFSELGAEGLTVIANFVSGWDGRILDEPDDAQEFDVTIDYRPKGKFDGFWLRLRGSWLHEDRFNRHGTDVRVILRYDFRVI